MLSKIRVPFFTSFFWCDLAAVLLRFQEGRRGDGTWHGVEWRRFEVLSTCNNLYFSGYHGEAFETE
jgi:hypothetical protein